MYACHSLCGEIRRQLVGFGSLIHLVLRQHISCFCFTEDSRLSWPMNFQVVFLSLSLLLPKSIRITDAPASDFLM